MHTVERLIKSGQNNHGITLQPGQVQELLQEFAVYAQANAAMEARIHTITAIAGVLIERAGGRTEVQVAEYEAFLQTEGIDVNWDEEEGVIHVEVAQVAVPEMQVDDEDALGEEHSGVAPVSEDGGAEEPVEGHTAEGAGV